MSSAGVSRRSLFKAAGAGAAITAAPALIGCSNGSTGSVGSAGKKLTPWPTYVPAKTAQPDLEGTAAGVEPGYLKYPTDLVTAVKNKPGDGSDVTALVITYEPPPTPVGSNKLWSAVNTALGANLKLVLVPSATFQDKMATIQAGDDLADMMLAGFGNVPQQANFVQAKCQDLSEYLSGDNIKKYPNLANIPRYAWEGMGRIGGKIYGIPVIRPRSGNILMANQTLLKAAGGLKGWDKDAYAKEMGQVSGGKRWGMGVSGTNQWGGNYHYASWSLPNTWKVDGGKFSHLLEDPRFKDALDFQRSLVKNGAIYPDSATASTVDLKTLFYNQTIVSDVDGFVAYHTAIPAVKNKFVVDFGRPYTVDGKTSMWFGSGYFGYTVLKKASKKRIEMLLRIIDFFAAPFGSKEYELTHFGVEGQHFTRDSDGQIHPTALADKENPDTVPFRYISEAPPVSYYPGAADAAQRQYDYDKDTIPLGVANPANGLHSDTFERTQAKLLQIENDGITAIVTGRQPVSSWDTVLKNWKAAGGTTSATEFAKEYSAQQD